MQVVWITCLTRLIVDGEISHVDTCSRTRNALHSRAGTFKTFEHHLEQLALLRVHIRSFEVVDTEKAVIELAYVFIDEVTTRNIRATATIAALWVVEAIDIVALGRNQSLGRLLFDEKLPEVRG